MARELEYLAEAVIDAEGAARWYSERSPTAAIRFSAELDEAEAAILDRPEAWPTIGDGNRHYLLRRFPFSVVYRVSHPECLLWRSLTPGADLTIGNTGSVGLPNGRLQPTASGVSVSPNIEGRG